MATNILSSKVLLCCLGAVYLVAFTNVLLQAPVRLALQPLEASLYLQAQQVLGESGDYARSPWRMFATAPSLIWLHPFLGLPAATMLELIALAGVAAAFAAAIGAVSAPVMALLWVLHLSLQPAGVQLLPGHGDPLLLEAGWVALWLATALAQPASSDARLGARPPLLLLQWLLLRWSVASAWAKLHLAGLDGGGCIAALDALILQGQPSFAAWLARLLPGWLRSQLLSTALVLQLPGALLLLAPGRSMRLTAAAMQLGMQLVAAAAGGIGVRGLAAAALTLAVADDQVLSDVMAGLRGRPTPGTGPAGDLGLSPLNFRHLPSPESMPPVVSPRFAGVRSLLSPPTSPRRFRLAADATNVRPTPLGTLRALLQQLRQLPQLPMKLGKRDGWSVVVATLAVLLVLGSRLFVSWRTDAAQPAVRAASLDAGRSLLAWLLPAVAVAWALVLVAACYSWISDEVTKLRPWLQQQLERRGAAAAAAAACAAGPAGSPSGAQKEGDEVTAKGGTVCRLKQAPPEPPLAVAGPDAEFGGEAAAAGAATAATPTRSKKAPGAAAAGAGAIKGRAKAALAAAARAAAAAEAAAAAAANPAPVANGGERAGSPAADDEGEAAGGEAAAAEVAGAAPPATTGSAAPDAVAGASNVAAAAGPGSKADPVAVATVSPPRQRTPPPAPGPSAGEWLRHVGPTLAAAAISGVLLLTFLAGLPDALVASPHIRSTPVLGPLSLLASGLGAASSLGAAELAATSAARGGRLLGYVLSGSDDGGTTWRRLALRGSADALAAPVDVVLRPLGALPGGPVLRAAGDGALGDNLWVVSLADALLRGEPAAKRLLHASSPFATSPPALIQAFAYDYTLSSVAGVAESEGCEAVGRWWVRCVAGQVLSPIAAGNAHVQEALQELRWSAAEREQHGVLPLVLWALLALPRQLSGLAPWAALGAAAAFHVLQWRHKERVAAEGS